MKLIHFIVTVLMVLLGLLHISFIFPIRELNEDNLWFIGSGAAIMLTGLINFLVIEHHPHKRTRWTGFISNLLMCLLFSLALTVTDGLQVYTGMALFAAGAVLSILNYRRK